MTRYIFDTSMCLHLMNVQSESVAARLAQLRVGDVVISELTQIELLQGLMRAHSRNPDRDYEIQLRDLLEDIPIISLDLVDMEYLMNMNNDSRTVQVMDQMVGIHAKALGLTLVTPQEQFYRSAVKGLAVENWLA